MGPHMRAVDLVYRTMFAELCERVMDASFESDFESRHGVDRGLGARSRMARGPRERDFVHAVRPA
jgi:hypothetical protein